MNKVEEYIKNHVKRDSNETEVSYTPWLTPDDARAIAQIVKEETIEKAVQWLEGYSFIPTYVVRDLTKALRAR